MTLFVAMPYADATYTLEFSNVRRMLVYYSRMCTNPFK